MKTLALRNRNLSNIYNNNSNNNVSKNMGTEILNPPPPLVQKLMELQAELLKHFPNNPNIVVAFNGQGGCLIGMEQQAMQALVKQSAPMSHKAVTNYSPYTTLDPSRRQALDYIAR